MKKKGWLGLARVVMVALVMISLVLGAIGKTWPATDKSPLWLAIEIANSVGVFVLLVDFAIILANVRVVYSDLHMDLFWHLYFYRGVGWAEVMKAARARREQKAADEKLRASLESALDFVAEEDMSAVDRLRGYVDRLDLEGFVSELDRLHQEAKRRNDRDDKRHARYHALVAEARQWGVSAERLAVASTQGGAAAVRRLANKAKELQILKTRAQVLGVSEVTEFGTVSGDIETLRDWLWRVEAGLRRAENCGLGANVFHGILAERGLATAESALQEAVDHAAVTDAVDALRARYECLPAALQDSGLSAEIQALHAHPNIRDRAYHRGLHAVEAALKMAETAHAVRRGKKK